MSVVTPTENTMQRECATIVITNMVATRNLGTVHMTNYTQMECVKTAISTPTIESVDSKRWKKMNQETS